jgi:hypothetical protein
MRIYEDDRVDGKAASGHEAVDWLTSPLKPVFRAFQKPASRARTPTAVQMMHFQNHILI